MTRITLTQSCSFIPTLVFKADIRFPLLLGSFPACHFIFVAMTTRHSCENLQLKKNQTRYMVSLLISWKGERPSGSIYILMSFDADIWRPFDLWPLAFHCAGGRRRWSEAVINLWFCTILYWQGDQGGFYIRWVFDISGIYLFYFQSVAVAPVKGNNGVCRIPNW